MRRRRAMTFLELLLLLVILIVLSSVVVPEMTDASTDVRDAQLDTELRLVRSQLARYRDDHGCWPDGERFVAQMTMRTNRRGEIIPLGGRIEEYPFGPYLHAVPPNVYARPNVRTVVRVGTDEPGSGDAGWQYNPRTGQFRPDTPFPKGR